MILHPDQRLRKKDLRLRFRLSTKEEREDDPERDQLSYKISVDTDEEKTIAKVFRAVAEKIERRDFSGNNGLDWKRIQSYIANLFG